MNVSATSFTPFTAFNSGYPSTTNATTNASASATSDAASSAASTGSSSSTSGVDTLSSNGSVYGLSSDDFMKLFLAQMQNQDPTKPMDDSQMLSELSQMTQVSTLTEVQKSLQGSQLAQCSALIGKNVTGPDVNGTSVNGVVTSVTQSTDAGLVLQVGSQYIKPDSVLTVTAPSTTTP
jgi:flagellar basal-body rod modification protein FlgD